MNVEKTALGMNEATFEFLARVWPGHERMFTVETPLGERQHVLVHPDEVRHVLITGARGYHKGKSFRNMKLLMGDGLIVQDGVFWQKQRKLMQPLFHERVLGEMTRVVQRQTEALLADWSGRTEPVNVTNDVSRTVLRTLLELLFSEDLRDMAGPDGKNPFELLTDEHERTYHFVPRFRALLRHVGEIMEWRTQVGRQPPDLLSLLMATPMSPAQIMDEVATLIVAGHETTATLLAWLWHILGFHPDVEPRHHGQLIDEALRLFPPVWIMDREAVADEIIGEARVAAGEQVIVPIYFLHRDPRFFTDPDAFRLDRPRTPNVIPFGAGPRRCIGEELALLEAKIHLETITPRLRLVPESPSFAVPLAPRVNLRPRADFRMRVELR
jgi:cytochrome P450